MIIAGVIPCYKTPDKALKVVRQSYKYLDIVICVDDCCPLNTGKEIENTFKDSKVRVLYHKENKGVGGAMKTGIKYALELGAKIIVKIDSDGQMSPDLIPSLINPIKLGKADFTKGNRFRDPNVIFKMPTLRFVGNFFLSFLTKLSTGYWELFDPTNGFIAINSSTLNLFNLNKIDNRYFFETDILFRCSINDIVVKEIAMEAKYDDETSNMYPIAEIPNFLIKHILVFYKRILYNYFIYDFNPGSISLLISCLLGLGSILFGGFYYYRGILNQVQTPSGIQTLFLAMVFISSQFLTNFIYYDVTQRPLFRKLRSLG